MTKSKVYFVSSRVNNRIGILEKFSKLLQHVNPDFITPKKNILIKTHFGEDGNTAFINPIYVRKAVNFIKSKGANPFVGDTCTLYSGRRKQGVTHLELALEHGFSPAVIDAPIVILDGLKGNYKYDVAVNQKNFMSVQLAGEFCDADGLIVLSHVKGHIAAGMGAAIKNLSMGLGTRTQKQRMHGDIKPEFKKENCIGCQSCVNVCPEQCITAIEPKVMSVDFNKCVGCAECITHCPTNAFVILWNESPHKLAEKMAETALAAKIQKQDKIYYFNFLINITPECDCFSWSDNPVVNDIGILASNDPIAIDQASYDLINKQSKLHNCVIENKEGEVFSAIHPNVDAHYQVSYGETIGLGNSHYELIDLKW